MIAEVARIRGIPQKADFFGLQFSCQFVLTSEMSSENLMNIFDHKVEQWKFVMSVVLDRKGGGCNSRMVEVTVLI